MKYRRIVPTLVALLTLSAPALWAVEQEHALTPELRAEVPALNGLHEVVFELWHGAWPEKNTARIKELMPEVLRSVDGVTNAELPGILRDKQAAWDEGVAALNQALSRYREAAEARSEQGLLDAVEKLHGAFEALVRTIRPVMPELQDYHVVLYRIYHYSYPESDYEALEQSSHELERRCGVLAAAEAPKRLASIAEELAREVKRLCAATSNLCAAIPSRDGAVIGKAIEDVHTRYQAVEGIFD